MRAMTCQAPSGTIKGLAVQAATPAADGSILYLPCHYGNSPMGHAFARSMAIATRRYWEEVSFGNVILDVPVAPSWQIDPTNPPVCDFTSWTAAAIEAAAKLGYSARRQFFLMTPQTACVWGGMSYVGGTQGWSNSEFGLPHDIIHEVGHMLGFYHTHAYNGSGPFDPATWQFIEYGDPFDPMGGISASGHTCASNKEFRGWIPPIPSLGRAPLSRVQLAPLEVGGACAVKVDRRPGGGLFVVEYRQPIGCDAVLDGKEAVIVRIMDGRGTSFVARVDNGQTFVDSSPSGGVAVRSNGSGSVDVATFDAGQPVPAFPAPPALTTPPYSIMPPLSPVPPEVTPTPPEEVPPVTTPSTVLHLGARFTASIAWKSPTSSGDGQAVSLTPNTGAFWFFSQDNFEVIVKVLDGTSVNGFFWVFFGALTDVAYTLTVTDSKTGAVQTYVGVQGQMQSHADTQAFRP
jgi:hypothetical protein